MKKTWTLLVLLVFGSNMYGQLGGVGTFDFLNLTTSARVASLGGTMVALRDNDPNLAFHNPSLLSDSMDNQVILNFVPYMAGIKTGYTSYTRHFKGLGTFGLGIHFINYGTFTAVDEYDNSYGEFTGSETAIALMYSKKLSPKFSLGITLKPVISSLESYSAFGLVSDLGISFSNNSKLFNAGMVLRNYGYQLTSYTDGSTEDIQPDLQLGISQKLAHAPFRFSVTLQNLLNWDLTYDLPEGENNQSSVIDNDSKDETFGNIALRHLAVGFEFLVSKHFFINFGYNARHRQELKIDSKSGTVGMSWGFGVNIKRFGFTYGSSRYHLAGSSNHFSLRYNLPNW